MSLLSLDAMSALLDMSYGPNRGTLAPDSHTVHLFHGDPQTGDGVELSGNGYSPVGPVDSDDWPDAVDGIKSMVLTWADPTGPWETATHWATKGDDDVWWDTAPIANPFTVSGAGPGPDVEISIFYDDAITITP